MEDVFKVVLGSGKEVVLRDMQMKYEDMAIRAVGNRAGKSQELFQKLFGDELLKILIIEIDGKKLSGTDVEKLGDLLNYRELNQVRKVVHKITGVDPMGEEKEPEITTVASSSGAQ
jgi:hypothetical protein